MIRYSLIFIGCLCSFQIAIAQNKYDQESRIKKESFPENAFALIKDYLENAKRVRFYQKTDSVKKGFEAKFKKGRLHYSVEFNAGGELEDVEFRINENDIPEDTWYTIKNYLDLKYPKLRVKKIQQQHPLVDNNPEKTVHDAFQNLMLPNINYKITFSDKTAGKSHSYDALFNAEGHFLKVQELF
ncbi:hypothetical protein [Flagellimonas iocasae]|uniref:Beta-lactamase-inhibitor-like PepSY-like domain-containing protein n=1 Tax=Flagellimonas iocasae TaxID=2055905 RepID=A0ABW4XWI3_9FLAO